MKKLFLFLLIFSITSLASASSLTPVAWYQFNETSGNIAHDSSGNGFDATICGTTSPIWDPQGSQGGCLSNDVEYGDMFVSVPKEAFATIDQQATFAWHVQLTDIYSPGESPGAFFAAANSNGDRVARSSAYPTGQDDFYLNYSAGSSYHNWWWDYSDNVKTNQWHILVLVFDAVEGRKQLYFLSSMYNGQLVADIETEPGDSLADIDVFNIFTRSTSQTENHWWDSFHGKIDQFMIWDRALTAAEIVYIPEPATISLLTIGSLLLTHRRKKIQI